MPPIDTAVDCPSPAAVRVLAISVDGGALGIGGRGPAWLLFDSGGVALSEDVESQWVYSVFTITAE